MRTKIIADLTSNHMGNIHIIESMIKCLADQGVDIVKTQSWQADKLRKDISDYQQNYDYYKIHELSDEYHYRIKEMCEEYGIEMLTTCFDLDRIDFLSTLGLKTIKVASPDTASYTLIKRLLDKFERLIISIGATTKEELDKTMEICEGREVVFLHCISIYPCPLNRVNMKRMQYIRDKGFRFGYSDHTLGTEAAKYAICLGAEYVEKHFTLNRYLPGRDQKMSATIDEMSEIVKWSRNVELMSGVSDVFLYDEELKIRENYIGKWGINS
jgi:sialic acid synthase SpsE